MFTTNASGKKGRLPDDGSGWLSEDLSYARTSYYRDVPEPYLDEFGHSMLKVPQSNYSAYDLYCLETQLYLFLKSVNREFEPMFQTRDFSFPRDEVSSRGNEKSDTADPLDRKVYHKMILTVELHYDGQRILFTRNFQQRLEEQIDYLIKNYRYYCIIFDNILYEEYYGYPRRWSQQILGSIPWKEGFFRSILPPETPEGFILAVDLRTNIERAQENEMTSSVGSYHPNDPDYVDRFEYWTIVFNNLLSFLYSQGTVLCDRQFAKTWNLLPASWSAFSKVIERDTYDRPTDEQLTQDGRIPNIPKEIVNYNDLRLFVSLDLMTKELGIISKEKETLYLAPWLADLAVPQKTEFLLERLSGKIDMTFPVGENYVEHHRVITDLMKREFFRWPKADPSEPQPENQPIVENPLRIFHDRLILPVRNYAELTKLTEIIETGLFESSGQVTTLKYSTHTDAQWAIERLPGLGRPFSVEHQNEDYCKPFIITIPIRDDEDPEEVSLILREKLLAIRLAGEKKVS